jgi:DNA polymerase-3 subunit epsilon
MLIIDRGRDVDERSVILIENGTYRGYGYFNLNFQITNPEILKSVINPMTNNRDTQHIIQGYLRKNKVMKIVKLT